MLAYALRKPSGRVAGGGEVEFEESQTRVSRHVRATTRRQFRLTRSFPHLVEWSVHHHKWTSAELLKQAAQVVAFRRSHACSQIFVVAESNDFRLW